MPTFKLRGEPPPDWSVFESAREWRAFERTVRAELDRRPWTGDIREGVVNVGSKRVGLQNLAQSCHGAPPEDWAELVRGHFDALRDAPGPEDRDAARAALKARLLNDGYLATADREYATRRVADDLQLVLAYDLPDRVMIVPREDVLRWGEEDELFEHGLAQARAEPGLELDRHEVSINDDGDVAPLFVLYGDSFFTATHALWAGELDPPASPYGTLVAVPTRHAVLAHPIRDGRVLGVIGAMLKLARKFEHEGPGSISARLYWLREGRLDAFDAWSDEEGLHFQPGPEFADLLKRLAG